MNHEEMENRLRLYFKREEGKGDISEERWQTMLAKATASTQERRSHWLKASFNLPLLRRVPAALVTLMLLIVVGGVSLWVAAPWDRTLPGGPIPVPGTEGPAGPVPGGPAPTYLQPTWTTSKTLVTRGEPLTVSVTLRNVWDKPIETKGFPRIATLDQVDAPGDVPVSVPVAFEGAAPDSIQPGEQVTLVSTVSSDVSSGMQAGRYSVGMDFQFGYTPQQPDMGTHRLGLNSGILFVVEPPGGALEKTVDVGQTREASGVSITLESVQFTAERTMITARAVLPASTPNPPPAQATSAPWEPGAPTPTPTPVPPATPPAATPPISGYVPATAALPGQSATGPTVAPPALAPTPTATGAAADKLPPGAPTPTPTPAPLPPGVDVYIDINAWYRVDTGDWRELRSLGYRGTRQDLHMEWTLGPVSMNARTFDFALTRILFVGGQRIDGLWEWPVPLQSSPST